MGNAASCWHAVCRIEHPFVEYLLEGSRLDWGTKLHAAHDQSLTTQNHQKLVTNMDINRRFVCPGFAQTAYLKGHCRMARSFENRHGYVWVFFIHPWVRYWSYRRHFIEWAHLQLQANTSQTWSCRFEYVYQTHLLYWISVSFWRFRKFQDKQDMFTELASDMERLHLKYEVVRFILGSSVYWSAYARGPSSLCNAESYNSRFN